MTTTPNYGFKIAEGTDTVNLLTQSYPNFTDLDSILKSIELTGITSSVATKAGTVFNIVRTNTDLNVLKFVATANYASGDTFTVDGVPVTATAVDGTALPAGAFVINQTVMALLNGTVLTVLVGGGISGPIDAEDVEYDNTVSGLTATDVQAAIDELTGDIGDVNTAVTDLGLNVYTYVSGTITAGNTSITLSDAAILTTSFIDIYFADKVIAPTSVTVATGSVTVEIPADATNTDVAVRIANL